MKILKITSLVLLAILCIPFLPMSSASTAQPLVSIETSIVKTMDPVLPSPELPHRLIPLRILLYSQYADDTNELPSTLLAINNTYGTDYYLTELLDYTNLASALPGHDILLIPEQEMSNIAMMQTIGTAWASILPDWVNGGGIVILMDFANATFYGQGIHILNESGLMTISGVTDYYPAGSLTTVYRVDTSDALTRGVAASWSAQSGTISVDTTDGTIIADDGTDPVVVHKIMGQGHIVFLGFDLYATDPNYELLLGNAIRLHRHVVFDSSHFNYGDIFGSYSSYADDLVTAGFAVSNMGTFNPALFDACDVLVIPATTTTYTTGEIIAIQTFVEGGGGLFLLGDWSYWSDGIYPIANAFGYTIVDDLYLIDTDDYTNDFGCVTYSGNNLHNHSLTLDVTQFEQYYGGGFSALPAMAQSIITTDTDGTSDWDDASPADGVTVLAASTHELGRVVIALDFNWLFDDQDVDGDLSDDYFDSDNAVLGINTIRWLSAAGIKERIVLFEESHVVWSVTSMFLDFGNFLTSNGYTIHWSTTFHTSLLDEVHVLVIADGTPYSSSEIAAIKDFVAAGGGLFLAGEDGVWRDAVDPISNEFGIDYQDTLELYDSDENLGLQRFPIYDDANIETHPIMEGISRIEMITCTGLIAIGSGTALVTTDTDGTSTWSDMSPAPGIPVLAATEYQLGRVVCFTDMDYFIDGTDNDGDGILNFFEHDNILFTLNSFQWLSENRAPIITVTSPNGGEILEGSSNTISWTANDLNNDAMTFDVLYSANGGGSWTLLVSGTTSTSVNFDVTGLPEGNQYLIRVIASDYDASTVDESDAVFSIESEGPTITNVQTDPATPLASLPVTVSAEIIDVSGVASAVCQVSTDGGAIWTDYAMSLTSGNTYEAVIGAYPTGASVEYRIIATDSSASARTSTTSTFSFTIAAGPPLPWWLGIAAAIIVIVIIIIILIFLLLRRKGTKS